MRNLKKALALVLALMMAVSLMSFASASDYADGGSVTKEEAVEVMSMINVFQGTDGGKFDPNGLLTRAQAAKIISYMKLGSAVADALPKDEAPFDDVKADRWYTGYVTYAKAEGIIAGRSETTFDPNGNVTGYEFGKMVLEAAGISGEYTGTSSWMLNINLALRGSNPGKQDLMKGVDAVLSAYITREQACQLAFNGLNYTPNGEATGNFIINATAGSDGAGLDGMVCSSRSEAAMLIAILDQGDGTTYAIVAETNNRGSLGDVVFGLEKSRGTSTFGAPANVWTSGTNSVTIADAPVASYEKTTGKTIKADLKMTGTVTAVIVTDGRAAGSATLNDADNVGGNGAQVDVYKTGDSALKIVVTNTYVATIASHTEAKGDTKESITLTLDTNKPGATTDGNTFETSNFTADDKGAVVLYTSRVSDDGSTSAIQSVTVPAEVTGTVTRFNTTANTFVVDGVTYKASVKAHSLKAVGSSDVGEEVTLYLDNKGNVIYADAVGGPDAAYAVVVDWAKGGTWASNTAYSVKLLLIDGSIVEKTVAKVGAPSAEAAPSVDGDVSGLVGKIVKYTESDNKVTLTTTTDANTSGSVFTDVVRNRAQLGSGLVANSKTVFLIGSKDGKTVSVYNGISAVPSTQKITTLAGTPWAAGSAPDFAAVAEDGVAKVVYIAGSEPKAGTTDVTDVIYVVGQGQTTKDVEKGEYKIYPAVVNGEITTIETTTDVTGMPAADNAAVLLKSVTKNDKDLITAGTAMDGENLIAVVTSNGAPANDVIAVGANSYVYDENTKVYVIENGEISVVAMNAVEANESGVSVTGYTKNGVLVELFILKGAAAAPAEHTHNYEWVVAEDADVTASENACTAGQHIQKCTAAGDCDTPYTGTAHDAGNGAWSVATEGGNDGTSDYTAGAHIQSCGTNSCDIVVKSHTASFTSWTDDNGTHTADCAQKSADNCTITESHEATCAGGADHSNSGSGTNVDCKGATVGTCNLQFNCTDTHSD